MCNLLVWNGVAILVRLVHEMPHDIMALLFARTSLLDDIHVEFCDSSLSMVTLAIVWQWGPVQHEVDRAETHVKIVVQVCKGSVKLGSHLLALKRVGRSINGDLSHGRRNVDGAFLTLQERRSLDEVGDFVDHNRNIRAEGVSSQPNFHELYGSSV